MMVLGVIIWFACMVAMVWLSERYSIIPSVILLLVLGGLSLWS